jgi:hypothetical protein
MNTTESTAILSRYINLPRKHIITFLLSTVGVSSLTWHLAGRREKNFLFYGQQSSYLPLIYTEMAESKTRRYTDRQTDSIKLRHCRHEPCTREGRKFQQSAKCSLYRSDLLASDLPLYMPDPTTWGIERPWNPTLLIIKEVKNVRLGNTCHMYFPSVWTISLGLFP